MSETCTACQGAKRSTLGGCEVCHGLGVRCEVINLAVCKIDVPYTIAVVGVRVPLGVEIDQARLDVARDALLEGRFVEAHSLLRIYGQKAESLITNAVLNDDRVMCSLVRPSKE